MVSALCTEQCVTLWNFVTGGRAFNTLHCASRTREGEFPQIPLSSSGNEGPASLSSSGGLASAHLLLPPRAWAILNFASLGLGSRQSTSMQCLLPSWAVHKYSKVCTSMQYPQLCNASWLQQFLPSFWSWADVATGCSHIHFEYLYTTTSWNFFRFAAFWQG